MYEVYVDSYKDGKGGLLKIGECETKREAAYLRRTTDAPTVIYKNGEFLNAIGRVRN